MSELVVQTLGYTLICIEAPHFVAGVVLNERGRISRAAPILSWSVGKPVYDLVGYCRRKGWRVMFPEAYHVG